jgi:uncharacterized OsmC-like protein
MEISATIKNRYEHHEVVVETDGDIKVVDIASKPSGYGSSVNGGELLLLSLATCFCNDIYREAAKRNIAVSEVKVVCAGKLGGLDEPESHFQYKTTIVSDAPADAIDELIRYTDSVAEVHNTLRRGMSVTLVS